MKKVPLLKKKNGFIFGVFIGLSLLAYWGTPLGHDSSQAGAWYSVIPPLMAVCLAVVTGKLLVSLFTAILVGGLLVKVPSDPVSVSAWGGGVGQATQYLWAALTDTYNAQILIFVVFIMMMIALLIRSGGLHGVVKWIAKYAQTAKTSKIATAFLGLVIFIDDYANTMIVGSTMRTVTDKYRVSREKLAFLVDATAAPIAGIALISTWIGYVVGLLGDSGNTLGVSASGYQVFVDSLPFRFYCLLMLAFVFINVFRDQDFGPMKKAEKRAKSTGAVFAKDAKLLTTSEMTQAKPDSNVRSLARTALVPFGFLISYLFVGLWLDGGGAVKFAASPWSVLSPSTWREVLIASENNVAVLAWGSFWGLLIGIFLSLQTARARWASVQRSLWAGFKGALLPCLILLAAWTLKGTCDGLMTGKFLVATVGDVFSPLWYPAVLFILSALTAFSTGTSWGTMAILIPTALPIAYQLDRGAYGMTLILTVAAVLDGAILGDHCSPISDTTIMSSISSHCDHLHHVRTQFPYALLVGCISLLLGFVPAALGTPPMVSLGLGVALIFLVFAYMRFSSQRGGTASRAA